MIKTEMGFVFEANKNMKFALREAQDMANQAIGGAKQIIPLVKVLVQKFIINVWHAQKLLTTQEVEEDEMSQGKKQTV